MNIAFCYESVLPTRGGCETYIAGLARRLVADGHDVHLYACRWDESALPDNIHYHPIQLPLCPRFLRPWCFASACAAPWPTPTTRFPLASTKSGAWTLSIPREDSTSPRPGTRCSNITVRGCAGLVGLCKWFDPAHRSFLALERKQYLGAEQPLVIAISEMVCQHFQEHYRLPAEDVRLVRLRRTRNGWTNAIVHGAGWNGARPGRCPLMPRPLSLSA